MKVSKIKWLSGWDDTLIWCPSQLERKFKLDNSVYMLYCRWRWDDPWSFSFFKNDKDHSNWIDIGWGLTEKDSVDDIHKYAEDLLFTFLKNTKRI